MLLVDRLKHREQALDKSIDLPLHTPLQLMVVPFLGGYISCPSHETPPEEKTRERDRERSVDGRRMKDEVVERARKHNKCKVKQCLEHKKNSGKHRKERLDEVNQR